MRCELGATPACKVHHWRQELLALRDFILQSELTEEVKWGVPCYTLEGSNVLIASAFKDYYAISFFKGSLLKDTSGLLEKPGASSQAARLVKLRSLADLEQHASAIMALIQEAISVEKAGLKVAFKPNPEPIPAELQQKLDEDPVFRQAFESLSPGRQRGYIIYFSGAKQSKTRAARIEKHSANILNGIGMHDRYQGRK